MPRHSEKNKTVCEAIEKLPTSEEFIPLYIEILSHTTSPLIWGAFAEMLKDICSSNSDFTDAVMDLLEDPKTVGARGYLLNALAHFKSFDKRAIDIVFGEIKHGNLECYNKSTSIIAIIYNSVTAELKDYIKASIRKTADTASERRTLSKKLVFDKNNYYFDEIQIC
jgi:hypothetical protein